MIGADNKIKRGFTLMEMLIALALFSLAVAAATDLFFAFERVSRKTERLEHLVSEARAATELIAREVRAGTVDYSKYASPLPAPASDLYLLSSTATPIHFQHAACARANVVPCLTLARGSNASPERLTGEDVYVRQANFFISPSTDPFAFDAARGAYGADIQPRATVALSLDNGLDSGNPNYAHYEVQTTISSRTYRR